MPRPPVRIVHLGLGAFHRAHQAWYTAHAGNAAGWGIASFTGRRPAMAEVLSGQDGLYTIIERSSTADRHEIITSLVEAEDGANISRLAEKFASPDVAVVTITVTEAGYRLLPDGSPDSSDASLVQDLATLHTGCVIAGAARRTQSHDDAGPAAGRTGSATPGEQARNRGRAVR